MALVPEERGSLGIYAINFRSTKTHIKLAMYIPTYPQSSIYPHDKKMNIHMNHTELVGFPIEKPSISFHRLSPRW